MSGKLRGIIKPCDIALAAVFLVSAVMVLFWTLSPKSTGGSVEIVSDGKLIGTYRLSEDREITVENAGHINVILIKDGAVSVESANCPDQYCVRHKAISYKNECIVCLPAKLVITITDGEESSLDAYAS